MTELHISVRNRNVVVGLGEHECSLTRAQAALMIEQLARALFEAETTPMSGGEAVAITTGARAE